MRDARAGRATMKKILSLALLALMVAASGASSQETRRKRVAIVDFDYATVHSGVSAVFGQDVDVGRGIADLLVTNLVKNGTYSVIERTALNRILAEQNFSNSDRANPTSAARIGKLLGVDAIIVGSITQFGHETRTTNIGGSGGGFGGFGIGGFGHKKSKAIVAVTARVVDVDTGEIMAVAEGRGESKRESTSLLGGGGDWHGFGAGRVDFGTSDFQSTIIGEAVKASVDRLTIDVVGCEDRLQIREIVIQGLIAAVEGGDIVLNVGAKHGLKVGDRLSVERVTKEIKDPATGQVIRRLSTPVGVLAVVDVDESSALASVVSGGGFKAGDAVKRVTR
jgi:curli biogenesis system outer membrane secretion channel CsgG